MFKRLTFVFLVALSSACRTTPEQPGCTTQVCTDIFASVIIHFTDKSGVAIFVSNFTAVNQRTHLTLQGKYTSVVPVANTKNYVIADDSMLDQLSTEGDDVLITATDPTTNQTKSVTVKISGGCNCHVAKISGADNVAFD